MSIDERFWIKVNKTETCWLWAAGINSLGYGKFQIGKKSCFAHRVSYELSIGPIPEGLSLDHLCRVRHCVNPAHLEPVTQRENIMRGNGIAAKEAAKTHCPKNHPYDEENTRNYRGKRFCKACNRDR